MFCATCKDRDTCKEICRPLKNYLRTKESDKLIGVKRLYHDEHIDRMEIPYDPQHLGFVKRKENERIEGRER